MIQICICSLNLLTPSPQVAVIHTIIYCGSNNNVQVFKPFLRLHLAKGPVKFFWTKFSVLGLRTNSLTVLLMLLVLVIVLTEKMQELGAKVLIHL